MGGRGSGRKVELRPAHRAGEQLARWLEGQPPKTLEKLAADLDVSPRTVSRWVSGQCQPFVGEAITLEDLTGGYVDIRSWPTTRR